MDKTYWMLIALTVFTLACQKQTVTAPAECLYDRSPETEEAKAAAHIYHPLVGEMEPGTTCVFLTPRRENGRYAPTCADNDGKVWLHSLYPCFQDPEHRAEMIQFGNDRFMVVSRNEAGFHLSSAGHLEWAKGSCDKENSRYLLPVASISCGGKEQ